jgi:hypothetical protein
LRDRQQPRTGNSDPTQGDACDTDDDNDVVLDTTDNRQFVTTPRSRHEPDGYCNLCDADYDTTAASPSDFGLFRLAFGKLLGDPAHNPDVDADGDGAIGIDEFGLFKLSFLGAPGPSGLACAGTPPCPLP